MQEAYNKERIYRLLLFSFFLQKKDSESLSQIFQNYGNAACIQSTHYRFVQHTKTHYLYKEVAYTFCVVSQLGK